MIHCTLSVCGEETVDIHDVELTVSPEQFHFLQDICRTVNKKPNRYFQPTLSVKMYIGSADLPYKIHASQGQGDVVIGGFEMLIAAKEYCIINKDMASFAIELPNGEWYDWSK